MKLRTKFTLTALALATLVTGNAHAMGEVNLYSARKEALIKPLLDKFTVQSGIKVNLVTGKADALIKRLESEGRNTPADLLITTDAGRLHRAKAAGLLQPVKSAALEQAIPPQYREPNGEWYGLSVRARTIMYNKDKVNPKELNTYEELASPKWKKRICIRSSSNIYNQSLVASMIAANGTEITQKWAQGMVANLARPPRGGDRDQIKAAAAGECDIAVANTYYFGALVNSKKEEERQVAAKIGVFWPNQADRGSHVNISGAGVTKHARNKDNAVKLIEFLASDESQKWYAEVNNEYPVREGVAISDTLKAWGSFKSDVLNLAVLGDNNAEAVRIMDRANWR
jgi:iron(III) transport system substrate-binding protein